MMRHYICLGLFFLYGYSALAQIDAKQMQFEEPIKLSSPNQPSLIKKKLVNSQSTQAPEDLSKLSDQQLKARLIHALEDELTIAISEKNRWKIANAKYELGHSLLANDGSAEGQHRGFTLIKEAANGVLYKIPAAIKLAAEMGDAEAQYTYASHLRAIASNNNRMFPADPDESLKWFLRAAQQGELTAVAVLADAYSRGGDEVGLPVSVDLAKGFDYKLKLAFSSQYSSYMVDIGFAYENGEGTPKNEVEALAWFYVASSRIQKKDNYMGLYISPLEVRLGREVTLLAQERSREIDRMIRSGKTAITSNGPQEPEQALGSGTGTIISKVGHILTAAHVVYGSKSITVITSSGEVSAIILKIDLHNDLAVLKLDHGSYQVIPIGVSDRVRLGENVATIGFPNRSIQGHSPKVTRGEISSMSGAGDDPRMWQVSVPVQPGNSGGPLLDANGKLVGVVVAKLGIKAAKVLGDIPQNVNYAVKASYAMPLIHGYIDENGPPSYQVALKFEDMIAGAQKSVVLILVR
jgi:S1-C subfamily serine protease